MFRCRIAHDEPCHQLHGLLKDNKQLHHGDNLHCSFCWVPTRWYRRFLPISLRSDPADRSRIPSVSSECRGPQGLMEKKYTNKYRYQSTPAFIRDRQLVVLSIITHAHNTTFNDAWISPIRYKIEECLYARDVQFTDA